MTLLPSIVLVHVGALVHVRGDPHEDRQERMGAERNQTPDVAGKHCRGFRLREADLGHHRSGVGQLALPQLGVAPEPKQESIER